MPTLVQCGTTVIGGDLFIFGGILLDMSGIKFQDKLYSFPLKTLPFFSEPISRCTWKCCHCGIYSTRKCSLCKEYPFCSSTCETNGKSTHLEDCARAGGVEDPRVTEMRKLQSKIQELELALHGEEQRTSDLMKELAQQKMANERLQAELGSRSKSLDEMNASQTMLMNLLKEQSAKIEEKEKEVQQTEKMRQELAVLQTRKTKLTALLLSRQSEIKHLSGEIQTVKTRISENEKLEQEKINALNGELHKLQAEAFEHKQQIVNSKLDVERLKDDLAETKEKELCTICLEIPKDHALGCGHLFCIHCITNFITNSLCPTCRTPFVKPQRIYL